MIVICEKLNVTRPCLLIADGDSDRLEVLRSPAVTDAKRMYQPVREFINRHGLVLAARETFDDDDWIDCKVEVSVYVAAKAE